MKKSVFERYTPFIYCNLHYQQHFKAKYICLSYPTLMVINCIMLMVVMATKVFQKRLIACYKFMDPCFLFSNKLRIKTKQHH